MSKRIYLRWFIRISAVFAIVFFIILLWNQKKPLCDKCNVILVSIDTLSSLHLPCYGYERNTAPNLCAFADRNITFLNSYSEAPITLDSHFSMITSLYPHSHKMTEILGVPLSEKHITMAQLFRANGYKTIFHGPINDFHLPLDRGFERGFDLIEPDTLIETWKDAYPKVLKNAEQHKPTFLFLHTYAVHTPLLTGHKEKHLYTDLPEYPEFALTQEEFHKTSKEFYNFVADEILRKVQINVPMNKLYHVRDIANELKDEQNLTESEKIFNKIPYAYREFMFLLWDGRKFDINNDNQVEYMKALYDERIHQMDEELKHLLDLVDDPRLSKNTILIITADHGAEFKEHGLAGHANNLYRTSTAVPLIVHIPGVGPKKIKDLVQGIDIYPTVINLVGIYPKSKLEGLDLAGLIRGEKNAKTNKYVFAEYQSKIALQDNRYRFYYDWSSQIYELYDLSIDSREQNNIASLNSDKIKEFINHLNPKKN